MQLTFSHSTKLRVRYGETDQMGYCYYGNYAQYCEVGRVEAMRQVGMSYRDMEAQGIMLPVSEFSIQYLRPAYYDDELQIITHIAELKGSKLTFHYEIQNADLAVISRATTVLVFVNKEYMRPIKPPKAFQELLSKFEQK